MNTTLIRKTFFYIVSIGLLSYILISIGIVNIYKALVSANIFMVAIALLITFFATLLRIYKFKLLLNNKDQYSIFEIFITSRIGKEISFAGYFIPLIKRSNRNDGTLQNLIVDRYTEILSTLVIALISCFVVLGKTYFESVIFIAIAAFLLVLIIIPFVNVHNIKLWKSNKLFVKLLHTIHELQDRLALNSSYILKIYSLSIIATALDFLTALFIFKACNVHVNFFVIAIVWASSGLVSILAFMIIGSTEISVIYLYFILAGVNKAITASFVVISRLLNLVILGILFLYFALFFKKKQTFISVTNNHA